MITRIDLPGLIERGRDTAITLDVYNDVGTQQTASAATVVLYDGSEEVVASVAATSLGPPASYTVTAATTTNRALSSRWLAVWTMTIGGTDYVFRQPVMLVRDVLYPVIIDEDLTDHHSDLNSLRDTANMTTFEPYRSLAWKRIQRKLIRQGNRPALIMDPQALADLHVFESLALIFKDFASSLGDARFRELAEDYRTMADAEWTTLRFRYDSDEDGRIGSDEQAPARPVTYFSRPPSRWWR